jgi:hypothetical protein
LHDFALFTGRLCGIRVEFREILSRIPAGFESRQNQAIARNPGVGMSGQVLVHPSHICQIGESDQGHFDGNATGIPLPENLPRTSQ